MANDWDEGVSPVARGPLKGEVVQPHRGQTVMVLGILSIFFAQLILGPIAWIMGNNDLKEMDAGRMDPSGRDNTTVGKTCGMVGTILGGTTLGIVLMGFVCCMGLPMIGLLGGASSQPSKSSIPPPIATPTTEMVNIIDTDMLIEGQAPKPGHQVTRCPRCNQRLEYKGIVGPNDRLQCDKCQHVFPK